jgi:hypothetical protein
MAGYAHFSNIILYPALPGTRTERVKADDMENTEMIITRFSFRVHCPDFAGASYIWL